MFPALTFGKEQPIVIIIWEKSDLGVHDYGREGGEPFLFREVLYQSSCILPPWNEQQEQMTHRSSERGGGGGREKIQGTRLTKKSGKEEKTLCSNQEPPEQKRDGKVPHGLYPKAVFPPSPPVG